MGRLGQKLLILATRGGAKNLDKKPTFARYAILVGIGTILSLKIYLWFFFVIDFIVGAYSVCTTLVVFMILLVSYVKFKDPYTESKKLSVYGAKPLVSIIIPVKNEEDHIRHCIDSCTNSTYSNKEIIVVNDGSTDKTHSILDQIQRESPNVQVIHLPKNIGKKKAIHTGSYVAKGEIFVFMDSDCSMADDAVEKIVEIFISDRTIGAVTAHGRVLNASNGNVLEKIQDVWYDGQFRIIKGMESTFSSVTCCSGALSAYRRAAVEPYLSAWANDRFLGKEFRFATDRLLTSYVLRSPVTSTPLQASDAALHQNQGAILNQRINAKLDLSVSSGSHPVLEQILSRYDEQRLWKIKYSPSVRVSIVPPKTFRALIKQQIRWRKSFIRSIFATGGIYWRRPFPAAALYYLQVALRIIRPYIIIRTLVQLPFQGDFATIAFYLLGILFVGMVYSIDFRLRNPGDSKWLYRSLMTLMSTFILSWLMVYALVTIRKAVWR